MGAKTIKNFLEKDFGIRGTKTVKLEQGEYLRVIIPAAFGCIRGGALYRVKERKRSSDVLELVGVMPIEEIRGVQPEKARKN